MLNPEPTEQQIETVREIAHLSSFKDTEFYLNRLNGAEWNATIQDIAEWAKVKNKHTIIKSKGLDIDTSRNRLDITNRVRRRFGLSELDENGQVRKDWDFETDDGTTSVGIAGAW